MTADKGLPEYYVMIRDLPAAERSLNRFRNDEQSHLSNAKRPAIVLRTGTTSESVLNLSGRFLSQFDDLVGLSRDSYDELQRIHRLGKAKPVLLKASRIGSTPSIPTVKREREHSLPTGLCKSPTE